MISSLITSGPCFWGLVQFRHDPIQTAIDADIMGSIVFLAVMPTQVQGYFLHRVMTDRATRLRRFHLWVKPFLAAPSAVGNGFSSPASTSAAPSGLCVVRLPIPTPAYPRQLLRTPTEGLPVIGAEQGFLRGIVHTASSAGSSGLMVDSILSTMMASTSRQLPFR